MIPTACVIILILIETHTKYDNIGTLGTKSIPSGPSSSSTAILWNTHYVRIDQNYIQWTLTYSGMCHLAHIGKYPFGILFQHCYSSRNIVFYASATNNVKLCLHTRYIGDTLMFSALGVNTAHDCKTMKLMLARISKSRRCTQ